MGILERKEREREARRSAILDAAEAVFKQKGFANATMDDIARDAELAKGTVYLYYRSKEELQVGLAKRGLDLMAEFFEREFEASQATGLQKLTAIGDAYWKFAQEHYFYFSIMHILDLPYKPDQMAMETISGLQNRSDELWNMLTAIVDQAKADGIVKEEVASFSVGMLLWLNCTGILRFNCKVQSTPDSVWAQQKKAHNPCDVDFKQLYDLNNNLLLHEIVTEKGRGELPKIAWPSNITRDILPCAPDRKEEAKDQARTNEIAEAFLPWPTAEQEQYSQFSL